MLDDPTEPYQTPDFWTADHVMTRMIWAFETLLKTRGRTGPAGFGSGWPSYVYEYEDLLAQESPAPGETMSEAEERRRGEQRPVRLSPNKYELDTMDESFVWPLRYLGGDNATDVVLCRWAWLQAREIDDPRSLVDVNKAFNEAVTIRDGLLRDKVFIR